MPTTTPPATRHAKRTSRTLRPHATRALGFTLAELLVVIVVIGILAAIAIPVFLSQADKASDTALKSDLANAAKLLQIAEANGETLPSEITAGQVVDLGTAGTFTASQTLTVTGSGETLCVEGTSESGDVYSADLDQGIRDYNCAGIQTGALVTDGLVLHLDAADPKSYPGSGDTWYDISGNNNDFLHRATAHEDNAFYYPGTTNNDYAKEKEANRILAGDSYTVEMVVTLDQLGNPNSNCGAKTSYFYAKEFALSNRYYGDSISLSPSGHLVSITSDANSNFTYFTIDATSVITTSQPFSLTFQLIVDDATGKAKTSVYVNGQHLGESNYTNGTYAVPQGPMKFGDTNNCSRSSLVGDLHDVRFYNRALTASEVQKNFDAIRERYGI